MEEYLSSSNKIIIFFHQHRFISEFSFTKNLYFLLAKSKNIYVSLCFLNWFVTPPFAYSVWNERKVACKFKYCLQMSSKTEPMKSLISSIISSHAFSAPCDDSFYFFVNSYMDFLLYQQISEVFLLILKRI